MDTLYTLCRSVDRRHCLPLSTTEAAGVIACKKAYFHDEAKVNPLVKEIIEGGTIGCRLKQNEGEASFPLGPISFFRTHEVLRKTRSSNASIELGSRVYTHNEVADMFCRCVPNVKLHHLPWFSPGRYSMSVGLAWGGALLTSHIVARGAATETILDGTVLYYMGLYSTVAAIAYTAFRQNRDLRGAAPWNSALYLDLNADLLRRNSPALAVARKELIPKQSPFKTHSFYYGLARRIEGHGLDSELTKCLSAAPAAGTLV